MDGLLERSRALFFTIAAACLLAPASASALAVPKTKPLKIKTSAVELATATVPFSEQLAASGGTPPYTFSVQAGELPEGLSLSPEGAISGTPAKAESASFTVEVADSGEPQQTATAGYAQKVQLDVAPVKLPKLVAFGNAYVPLSAAGGSGSYSFSLASGELPEGVELWSEPGFKALDGNPTRAGTYEFAIEARDESTGYTGQRSYKWKIGLGISPENGEHLPEGVAGQEYRATVGALGGGDYRYEIIAGQLPEGLTLGSEENNARIEGVPAKAETQKITVLATDMENGLTAKAKYTIVIAPFGFPRGYDELEEESHGEFRGRDDIEFALKKIKNGVATGTMLDGDGSTGTWRLTIETGRLVFNWPEINESGGFAYEGTCDLAAEQCTGTDPQGTWVLRPYRPFT